MVAGPAFGRRSTGFTAAAACVVATVSVNRGAGRAGSSSSRSDARNAEADWSWHSNAAGDASSDNRIENGSRGGHVVACRDSGCRCYCCVVLCTDAWHSFSFARRHVVLGPNVSVKIRIGLGTIAADGTGVGSLAWNSRGNRSCQKSK